MSNRQFANILPNELRDKIIKEFSEERRGNLCFQPYLIFEKLGRDLKVQFDHENFEDCLNYQHYDEELAGLAGINRMENGLTFCGMTSGGDWEHPVFFIIYWDGKKLRGYVPTDGNPWNTTTKQAYGNDEDADLKNAKKRWPDKFADATEVEPEDFGFDNDAIRNDILTRIQPKGTKKKH